MARRKGKITKRAQKFISHKIRKLRREGYGPNQSIAIAYAMARHKGYKVPRRR